MENLKAEFVSEINEIKQRIISIEQSLYKQSTQPNVFAETVKVNFSGTKPNNDS
jgi:hypothetical protein